MVAKITFNKALNVKKGFMSLFFGKLNKKTYMGYTGE
jgi:hypothetical protein